MTELSIQDLMDRLPGAFMPEKAAGMNANILFQLTGEKGGDWVVSIHDQSCGVRSGVVEAPDLTFQADAQDCLDVFTGKLDGMRAYMQGRLFLLGDMRLAMKLVGLFDVSKY